MKRRYFLPLNRVNVSQYFGRGIILPSKYIDGWMNDSQSEYSDSLLLCSKPLVNKDSCSLEILLTDEEEKEIITLDDSFSLFGKPLPISRIKHLCFSKDNKVNNTVYNIEQGNAFVPKHIIIELSSSEVIQSLSIYPQKNNSQSNNWSKESKFFDRLLGGFSLLQLAKENWQNYSDTYCSLFAFINPDVKQQLGQYYKVNKLYPFLKIQNESAIFDRIDEGVVSIAAGKENISIEKKRGLIVTENINKDSNTYLLSILATYGGDKGKRKSIDDFISSVKQKAFESRRLEELCLFFGINQGYFAFRNSYKYDTSKVEFKFKLDSNFEYILIESIYQYVFNGNNVGSFDYLLSIVPSYNSSVDTNKYKTYTLFDKEIIYEERPAGIKEIFKSFIKRFFFSELAEPFIKEIEKHKKYQLTKEQRNIEISEFKSLIEKPLANNLERIEKEMCSYHEDVISEYNKKEFELRSKIESLENRISELQKENQDLNNDKKSLSLMLSKFESKSLPREDNIFDEKSDLNMKFDNQNISTKILIAGKCGETDDIQSSSRIKGKSENDSADKSEEMDITEHKSIEFDNKKCGSEANIEEGVKCRASVSEKSEDEMQRMSLPKLREYAIGLGFPSEDIKTYKGNNRVTKNSLIGLIINKE